MPLKVTMKLVGHSDPDTTMKIYTKVDKKWEEESIENLNVFFEDKGLFE